MARNPFRRLCEQLAANYLEGVRVEHRTQAGLAGFLGALDGAPGLLERLGVWSFMVDVQQRIVGLREMLVKVEQDRATGELYLRDVRPDCVQLEARPDRPELPTVYRELRWRVLADGRGVWAWDVYDVTDPRFPAYRVVEAGLAGHDGPTLAALEGSAYPYRYTQGDRAGLPFLPAVLYHARRTGRLWDPYREVEAVEATMDVAAAYTFLQHGLFRASYPIRWVHGAMLAGAAVEGDGSEARMAIPTDPTSLALLVKDPTADTVQTGQWGPGVDPVQLQMAVEKLEAALSSFDGLDVGPVLRGSSNPMSAEALTISRQTKREAQQRYGRVLEPSDVALVELIAVMSNLTGAAPPVPEQGYTVEHRLLPLSPAERRERREHNTYRLKEGLMSRVDAYIDEHPGTSREEAEVALVRVAEEQARLAAAAPIVEIPDA